MLPHCNTALVLYACNQHTDVSVLHANLTYSNLCWELLLDICWSNTAEHAGCAVTLSVAAGSGVGLDQHAHLAGSTNHLHLYVTTQTSVVAFDIKTSSKVSNSA